MKILGNFSCGYLVKMELLCLGELKKIIYWNLYIFMFFKIFIFGLYIDLFFRKIFDIRGKIELKYL